MMSKEEELFMKLLVDRSPAIFQMAWSRGAFRFRILRSWDVLGTSSWTSIKSIMTILGDPNSSNRNMVSILMNWKVMRPTKSQVSLSFHPKKKLTVSEAKQFLDKPGILGFFRIVAMGLQKKGFVFPMSMGPDFGQLKGGRYAIFSQWLYRWPSSTWKKIEPQRVSTTKKPLNSESMFAPWFSSLFFFMSQGLNQDMWFLWPPRVGSLAPRIPMPPIPRFRATLCFRWLILVFLLIGGKLPTLGIFRSRSVKQTICFRCSHFHLVFWFGICDFEARNCCIWKAASTGWGGSWRFNPFTISPLPWSQGVLVTEFRINKDDHDPILWHSDPNFRLSLLLVLDCAHG